MPLPLLSADRQIACAYWLKAGNFFSQAREGYFHLFFFVCFSDVWNDTDFVDVGTCSGEVTAYSDVDCGTSR